MEVYQTDPLRYHRSLLIYLNELSLSDQTSNVSLTVACAAMIVAV